MLKNVDELQFDEPQDLENTWRCFNSIGVDWSFELSKFIRLTQYTSHIDMPYMYDSDPIIKIFYLLTQYQPEAIASAFPKLRTLTLEARLLHKPMAQWFIARPTLTRINIDLSGQWVGEEAARRVMQWLPFCTASLKSLSLSAGEELASSRYTRSATIAQILTAREWTDLEIPSMFFRPAVLRALASMNVLKSLTLGGDWCSWRLPEENMCSLQISSVTDVLVMLRPETGSANSQLIKVVALAFPKLERLDS
ncbi:hypothetical protein FRC07_007050 [Ceratobasidium sp. 392]|nr:hypothetical protein FRC07_007050 [Ceratobasidium sp. 392]